MQKLLEIKNLKVRFDFDKYFISAVQDASLEVNDNEIVGLAGESGSGKTITAFSITKILPVKAKIMAGEIIFKNQNLLEAPEENLRQIRGKEIAYIFQEPIAYLNPVMTVGEQIMEAVILHQFQDKTKAKDYVMELLNMVKIPQPQDRFYAYPHQLSGGMNQRIMLAMALACKPSLLIADEPTTALDVTIEAAILDLLLELKAKLNFSILFITHNLSILHRIADRIYIMHKGNTVESGTKDQIFSNPKHPHTKELIEAYLKVSEV